MSDVKTKRRTLMLQLLTQTDKGFWKLLSHIFPARKADNLASYFLLNYVCEIANLLKLYVMVK